VTPEPTPDPALGVVLEFIQARTGLVFPENRQRDAEACIRRAMHAAAIDDPQRLPGRLDADAGLFDTLITALTVAETYFFREPRQFEFIRLQILPELVRARGPDLGLRCWSAGCSSGEEPYSLAILLEQERLAQRASIVATDICATVLTRARKASYGSWSFRSITTEAMAPYFDRRGDRSVLKDRLRQRVTFRALNLAAGNYPSPQTGTSDVDLILCRNVLIYFDQGTVARVARRLFTALAAGGWLLTGPSDPPLWDLAPFEAKVTEAGVLYRRSPQVVALPSTGEPAGSLDRMPRFIRDDEPSAANGAATAFAHIAPQPDPEPTPSLQDFDQGLDQDLDQGLDRGPPPPWKQPPDAIARHVRSIRALADAGKLDPAVTEAAAAIQAYPLAAELHYMRAVVLDGLGQGDEATASLRRVIYLDPSLAVAHFTLGSILWRSGAAAEARRCYRNALALATGRPPQEVLRLSEGETAGRMTEAARNQLALIDRGVETTP
jgi:chemotaxis protein methyltransferase CheR